MKRVTLMILLMIFVPLFSHVGKAHYEISKQGFRELSYYWGSYKQIMLDESVREDYGKEPCDCGIVDIYVPADPSGIGDPINCFGDWWDPCTQTKTHFWNQDKSFPDGVGYNGKESAYEKANRYASFDSKNCPTLENDNKEKLDIYGDYNNGNLDDTLDFFWRPGRIVHLLEDMSVQHMLIMIPMEDILQVEMMNMKVIG